jgi:cytochrome c oxidase subunit 4
MNTEKYHTYGEHIILNPRVYFLNLLALLFLTVVTFFASYVNLGFANVIVALLIATAKTLLVALFFMHLRYERGLVVIFAAFPFLFFAIMIGFFLFDVLAR